MSEHQLVDRILAGDAAAADEFVRQFKRQIYTVLMKQLRLPAQEAQEVFQNIFVHLWEHDRRRLRLWQRRGRLAAYLAIIARHVAIDYLRARRAQEAELDAEALEIPSPEPGPDRRIIGCEACMRLREALGHLSPRDRDIVERRYLKAQSYREISEATGLTPSHIGAIVTRSGVRLRKLLAGERPTPGQPRRKS